MNIIEVKNLSFTYPLGKRPALDNVSFAVREGEFITLCGLSGGGKTTLLRHLKPALSPQGTRTGEVLFRGSPIEKLTQREQAGQIGFIMQSPENQIVADKVWHELAFGLENLGTEAETMRLRVAETASFFGIGAWFDRDTATLSGGQKQLLNLAAVMAMQPRVLILDEPTSQLDPIAASDFIHTLYRLNREMGVTVILSEHRLEEALPLSDRVLIMEEGRITAFAPPEEVGRQLKASGSGMFCAMPAPMRVWAMTENPLPCPVTVRQGREWLKQMAERTPPKPNAETCPLPAGRDAALEMKSVSFAYGGDETVLTRLDLTVPAGQVFALMGSNGAGKSTLLSLLGLRKPEGGSIKLFGQDISGIPASRLFGGTIGLLPQNPQLLFSHSTLREDMEEMGEGWQELVTRFGLDAMADANPLDLSWGQLQRAAIAKIMVRKPRLLVLDEPTKGMDAPFKRQFGLMLREFTDSGGTVLIASHDSEFCARYADLCAMLFAGNVFAQKPAREFFAGNGYYTTAVSRMARDVLPNAVTEEDVAAAFGANQPTHTAETGENNER